MRIARLRTRPGKSPLDGIALSAGLLGCAETGQAFDMAFPAGWSHTAALRFWELACLKGMAPAGRGKRREPVNETPIQAIERIAGALAYEGWQLGYFDAEADSLAFAAEITRMMADQVLTFGANALGRFGAVWAHGWQPAGPAPEAVICDPETGAPRPARAGESCNLQALAAAAHRDPLETARLARRALGTGADVALDLGPCADPVRVGALLEALLPADGPDRRRQRLTLEMPGDAAEAEALWTETLTRDRDLAALACGRGLLDWAEETLAEALTGSEEARWEALRTCCEIGLPPQVIHRLLDQQMLAASLAPDEDRPDPAEALSRGAGALGPRLALRLRDAAEEVPDWWLDASWITGRGVLIGRDAGERIGVLDGAADLPPGTGVALAALSARAFVGQDGAIDTAGLAHATRLATIAAEILSSRSAMPDGDMARAQFAARPIGLVLTGVGAELMRLGLAHDSPQGRDLAATLAALVDANGWATLAEMAAEHGAAPAAEEARVDLCDALRLAAAHATTLSHPAGRIAATTYRAALREARGHGLRSITSAMAPADGDLSVLLDCDSCGFEPPAAIVRFRRAPGGGHYKTLDKAALAGLARLGYSPAEIDGLMRYAVGHGTLARAPGINHDRLRARGFDDPTLARLEAVLPGVFDIRHAFTPWALGDAAIRALLGERAVEAVLNPEFDLLLSLGFKEGEIEAANLYCCGAHGLAGGPGLEVEHEAVFAVGAPSGRHTDRLVTAQARLAMAAAVEPFLAGAMAALVEVPVDADRDDVAALAQAARDLGLAGISISRDGASLAHAAAPFMLELPEPTAESAAPARPEASPDAAMVEPAADIEDIAALRRALEAACAAALAAGVAPEILVQAAGAEGRPHMADSLANLARGWMAERLRDPSAASPPGRMIAPDPAATERTPGRGSGPIPLPRH